jgi:hypothetical protein
MWHFAYSMALIFGTTSMHAGATLGVLRFFRLVDERQWSLRTAWSRVTLLAGLIFLMSLVAYLETVLWAYFYVTVGALPSYQDALYFSIVTFTTLGYGDFVLAPPWRVLGAVEAVNGIILFGWTTAIIVASVQRVFSIRGGLENHD